MKILCVGSKTIIPTTLSGLLILAAGQLQALSQPSSQNDRSPGQAEFYYVEGEVKVPQRYLFTDGLTLTKAIKIAKGFTASASPTEVSLIRTGGKVSVVDVKAIEQGKARDIELRPGDKVQVHRKQSH